MIDTEASHSTSEQNRTAILVTAILSISLILTLLIAWGMRFANEDLFTALCAGRDYFEEKLAQPDQWSFVTNGKIWVNQSWLSGVIYYESFLALQETGPFLLKVVVLGLCALIMFFRCRRMAAAADASLVAMIFGILGAAPFMGIRPENFGLLMLVVLTTFLTGPRAWGYWRPVGSVAAVWLWSGLHGSFMLGLGLIGLKAFIEAARYLAGRYWVHGSLNLSSSTVTWTETISWMCAWVAAGFATVFGSPFGFSNLVMPFQQIGQTEWVAQNKDWLPLLHGGSLATVHFLTPPDVLPFLFILLVVVAAALVGVFNRSCMADGCRKVRGDLLMEILTSVILVAMAFRFRRLTLFAAISLIPFLAFLVQSFSDLVMSSKIFSRHKILHALRGYAPVALACSLLIFLTWAFSTKTVLRHLPGNPTLPDMPVPMQHMHWNSIYSNLVVFLKNNGIGGRIFSSWPLADFLFFHVPEVKVFVSGRAQTIYSPENLREYSAICRTNSKDIAASQNSLDLLDKLEIKAAVLPRSAEFGPLTDVLMRSRRWIGVYVDTRAFVFIRNDPETVRRIASASGSQGLWYPDRRTLLLGDALVSMNRTGRIPSELEADLKDAARNRPEDAIYWIMGYANRDGSGCIEPHTRDFLLSELNRLSRTDFMIADGANLVLKSVVEMSFLLAAEDKRSCLSQAPRVNFDAIAKHYASMFNRVTNEFR
jgi:hypothetical protein